jgi:large subunit ribosomal protein L4
MVSILTHLDVVQGDSLLVTTAAYDANVHRSARNIAGLSVAPASDINAYTVLKSRRMLVTKAALDTLVASAKPANGKSRAADSKA